MSSASSPSAGALTAEEVLNDLQATVGFEQLEDKAKQNLLQRQQQAYDQVQTCIDGAGDAEDLVLPRPLEKELAEIYALKEQAVALKRSAIAERDRTWQEELYRASNEPLSPVQQEQMAAVAREINSRAEQVKLEIHKIDNRKDKEKEKSQRSGQDANEIAALKDFLKQPSTSANPDRSPQNSSPSQKQDKWSK